MAWRSARRAGTSSATDQHRAVRALTVSGLTFIPAATDNLMRASDLATRETLCQDALPVGGQATPMTYEANGRRYPVFTAGGRNFVGTPVGEELIAYVLPADRRWHRIGPLRTHHADRSESIKHREQLRDEALKESFPASDPPSIAPPHLPMAPREKKD